jgi:hypothetical protein
LLALTHCGIVARVHDESEQSENPGIFRGLIDFVSNIDDSVKEHIENNVIFKGTSKTIQNELLDCMLKVCQEIIKKEMTETEFVAVMADETTDISNQLQLVIVYRYEVNGNVCERFWGFFNPDGHITEDISNCLLNELNVLVENLIKILLRPLMVPLL